MQIDKAAKPGTQPVELARSYKPFAFALGAEYLYWITYQNPGSISRIHLTTKKLTPVASNVEFGKDIVVGPGYIYYLSNAVRRIPIQGFREQRLTPLLSDARQIVLDKDVLYVAAGSVLMTIPTYCSGVQKSYTIPQGTIASFAVDQHAVYVLVSVGGVAVTHIYKMKKTK